MVEAEPVDDGVDGVDDVVVHLRPGGERGAVNVHRR